MKISKRPNSESLGSYHGEEVAAALDSPIFEMPTSQSVNSNMNSNANRDRGLDLDEPWALLVEDNSVNLKILTTYVSKEGWSCETATNGLEAVEKFRESPGKYVVVIIDISMPIMNGFEASRTLREFERTHFGDAHPESKPPWYPTTITALTGLDSADAQQEAFASGIDTFLTKPIKRQDIRNILEKCRP